MVKIERKDSDEARAAVASLEREKAKRSGTYNTPEVNKALGLMFAHKCYLCEQKGLSSLQIEHLVPHRKNRELMFDWNNLFLSCSHCNNIKNDRFTPILDCTKVAVDEKIAFRRHVEPFEADTLDITALDDSVETKNTVALLNEVYYGSTMQKIEEAKIIRTQLSKELNRFEECVTEYASADGEDKKDLECSIMMKLKWNAPFAAFKRRMIRDASDTFPELQKYCQ